MFKKCEICNVRDAHAMSKTIIDSTGKGLQFQSLKELYLYRDLFLTLAYREFRIRYAQTFLGFLWAGLQPLVTLVIFAIVFGRALQVDTSGVPYPVFALAGMSAWMYFSFVVSTSGKSLITDQAMISKIYFPRIITPLSKALVGLIDFAITFILLILFMIWYGVSPSPHMVWLPVFLLMALLASLTFGIWVSALSVRYRDIQHIIPFMVQVGLYATPVAYPSSLIPEKYQLAYFLINPMAGVIEGFRWSIIGQGEVQPLMFYSFGLIALLFILGLLYFKKVERTMADIL